MTTLGTPWHAERQCKAVCTRYEWLSGPQTVLMKTMTTTQNANLKTSESEFKLEFNSGRKTVDDNDYMNFNRCRADVFASIACITVQTKLNTMLHVM